MVVFGTRPEAIKLAPVIHHLRQSGILSPIVVVTAQHRGMLDQVLDVFGIEPDVDLDLLRPGQSLTDITTRAVGGISEILAGAQPDALLVQGDTTTTFAAALSGYYHRIPVAHLEAGLRTFDRFSPFPEEMNRRLTTRLATLHLAPTPTARYHLTDEGVSAADIVVTGNTVVDALLWAVAQDAPWTPDLARLDGDRRRVLLVTAHRRESWGPAMACIGRAVADIARAEPDLLVVFSLHLNPIVRDALTPVLEGVPNIVLVEPVPYTVFARLMARAYVILTDSGGIQEECPTLGKPVLVMREKTERPEAIVRGTARLVGTDSERIVGAVLGLLHDDDAYAALARGQNPYGDGHASRRTTEAIAHLLGLGPRPADFEPAVSAADHPPA